MFSLYYKVEAELFLIWKKLQIQYMSAEFWKEILLFEKGEVIEYSAIGTNGNDLNSPHLKQCYYLYAEY